MFTLLFNFNFLLPHNLYFWRQTWFLLYCSHWCQFVQPDKFNTMTTLISILQDILFTLPSFIICLREVCQCYPPAAILRAEQRSAAGSYNDASGSGVGAVNNDWLMSWLGQQTGQIFFSNASGMPFAAAPGPGSPVKMAAYHQMVNRATPPFVLLPSAEQSQLTIPPTGKLVQILFFYILQ